LHREAAAVAVGDDAKAFVNAREVGVAYAESCGQCPPCKLGTDYLTNVLVRLCMGEGTRKRDTMAATSTMQALSS